MLEDKTSLILFLRIFVYALKTVEFEGVVHESFHYVQKSDSIWARKTCVENAYILNSHTGEKGEISKIDENFLKMFVVKFLGVKTWKTFIDRCIGVEKKWGVAKMNLYPEMRQMLLFDNWAMPGSSNYPSRCYFIFFLDNQYTKDPKKNGQKMLTKFEELKKVNVRAGFTS